MNDDHDRPPICRQVRDHAVEGRDVMVDAALAAHVGSCVTCFRTLAELRDAPRLAAALRADAPAVSVSDRFWDDLAARTTTAAASAMAAAPAGAEPCASRASRRSSRRRPPPGCSSRVARSVVPPDTAPGVVAASAGGGRGRGRRRGD